MTTSRQLAYLIHLDGPDCFNTGFGSAAVEHLHKKGYLSIAADFFRLLEFMGKACALMERSGIPFPSPSELMKRLTQCHTLRPVAFIRCFGVEGLSDDVALRAFDHLRHLETWGLLNPSEALRYLEATGDREVLDGMRSFFIDDAKVNGLYVLLSYIRIQDDEVHADDEVELTPEMFTGSKVLLLPEADALMRVSKPVSLPEGLDCTVETVFSRKTGFVVLPLKYGREVTETLRLVDEQRNKHPSKPPAVVLSRVSWDRMISRLFSEARSVECGKVAEHVASIMTPLGREAWRPMVDPRASSAGKESRYYGAPWRPSGSTWPCEHGVPLKFIAQFRVAEFPSEIQKRLGHTSGLLQFFYNDDPSVFPDKTSELSVIELVDDALEGAVVSMEDDDIQNETALPVTGWVSTGIEYPDPDMDLNDPMDPALESLARLSQEALDALSECEPDDDTPLTRFLYPDSQENRTFLDKLGGWPRFAQSPDWPTDRNGDLMVYILQLASSDIMDNPGGSWFAADGTAHLFYSPATGEFKLPWACG